MPNMNTRPLIEMAISDITKVIENTTATNPTIGKNNATITTTPGLDRIQAVAQIAIISGTMIP